MGHNHSNHEKGHSHHHHFDFSNSTSTRIAWTIFLNISITVGQFIGGIVSQSVSLMSDAAHNFSDVIALTFSYVANVLSKREGSKSKTYGYKRAEIFVAFVNAFSLIVISILIFKEAIERISHERTVDSEVVIWFAVASIFVNIFSAWLLSKDSKENMNIKSSYLHLVTDVMTSFAVLLGGLAMKYFQVYWVDTLLSVLISVYLLISSGKLLIKSSKVLLQFSPEDVDLDKVIEEVSKVDGVQSMHHLHIWKLDDKSNMLEAHIELSEDILVSDFSKIIDRIEHILIENNINHSNLQPEISRCEDRSEVVSKHT